MSELAEQVTTTRRERWSWYFYDFGSSAYAAVVLLALIGLGLFGAIAVAERLALPWTRRPTRPRS